MNDGAVRADRSPLKEVRDLRNWRPQKDIKQVNAWRWALARGREGGAGVAAHLRPAALLAGRHTVAWLRHAAGRGGASAGWLVMRVVVVVVWGAAGWWSGGRRDPRGRCGRARSGHTLSPARHSNRGAGLPRCRAGLSVCPPRPRRDDDGPSGCSRVPHRVIRDRCHRPARARPLRAHAHTLSPARPPSPARLRRPRRDGGGRDVTSERPCDGRAIGRMTSRTAPTPNPNPNPSAPAQP